MRPSHPLLAARLLLLGGLIVASVLGGNAEAQENDRIARVSGGETLRIAAPGGVNFSLRLVAIVSDERCPARVTCAWANPPVITLEASAPGQTTQSFELSPDIRRKTRLATYLGASIEYVDLLPVPQDSSEFAKRKPLRAYTAVVKIGPP